MKRCQGHNPHYLHEHVPEVHGSLLLCHVGYLEY